MIDKINNNQAMNISKDSSAIHSDNNSKPTAGSKIDASLLLRYSSLVEKAKQTSCEQADAVENARQLLKSGQLDNPENIRQAAENILEFDI